MPGSVEMKKENGKKLTAAAVVIMMTAGLMPVNVLAETDETILIAEEATADEEPVMEEEIVSEETDEAVTEEEPEAVSDEVSIAREENAADSLGAFGPVFYYDENGEPHVCSSYADLSDVEDRPGATISGWYVAEGFGWGFNNRVTVIGETHIILMDNCGVIFNRGIQNNTYGNLSIWGGPAGNGQLCCIQAFETSGGNAGIGGDSGASGGTFNLHRGMVTANGQNGGAGVGGGQYCYGGFINIYGGTLNANGGNNSAGIGGGQYGDSGAIRIYGGSVTATGGAGAAGGAGIGCGEDRSGGDIHIYGGTVTATGGNGSFGAGAGIGGGDEGNGGTITISGGDITATGANWAAGIGGGNKGAGGAITIDGGTVRAFGAKGGAGIGGGKGGNSGVIILNSSDVEAHGIQAIGNGEGGIVESIQMAKGIGIEGKPYEERISGLNNLKNVKLTKMDYRNDPVTYYDEHGVSYICEEFTDLYDVYDKDGFALTDGWYVAAGTVTFKNRPMISGTVNIILTDGNKTTFRSGIRNNSNGHLIIWGQQDGSGILDCTNDTGKNGTAGIGGDENTDGGIVEIHGGVVKATGKGNAAGIGGGRFGSGGTISIYGGTVTAVGGYGEFGAGAGIGGGEDRSGGDIRIYGGTVNATGGNGMFSAGAGIGGGDDGNGGTITISGGNITATGANWAAGIGGGNNQDGGTITIDGGIVRAYGKKGGAGIGGGDDGNGGTITINTANVEAHGYRGIGEGEDGNPGTIALGDNIGVFGYSYSLRYDLVKRLSDVQLKEFDAEGDVVEYYDNGTPKTCTDFKYLHDIPDTEGATISEGWYAVEGYIGFNYRLTVVGTVNLILKDDSQVIFNRGIQNNIYGHLIIWAQEKGSGKLDCIQAFGDTGNAGIGGDEDSDGGILEIHGGNVTAVGQKGAAGIGGGDDGDGGTIVVNGGIIVSSLKDSKYDAAAIGGGRSGKAGAITINGGRIQAYASRGDGIGRGYEGDGYDCVTINGGDIVANGAHAVDSMNLELAECMYAENASPDADLYGLCRQSSVWLRTRS